MPKVLSTLKTLIELSPHTVTSASREAGLGQGTIGRWLSGQRTPRLDELQAALGVFGYELQAVPVPKPSPHGF